MLLRILSDAHLDFRPYEIPTTSRDLDTVLILAGDIIPSIYLKYWVDWFEDLAARFKSVVYVAGNHEHYDNRYTDSMKYLQDISLNSGVLFLENDVVSIDGIKIAGCTLWTNIIGKELLVQTSMNDYNLIYGTNGPLRPEDTMLLHNKSVKFLSQNEYDIVVTHHAPSFQSCGKYKANALSVAYATELGWLVEEKKPLLWIHGHTHSHNEYMMYDTLVVSNCVGYPHEKTFFQPTLEIDVSRVRPVKITTLL